MTVFFAFSGQGSFKPGFGRSLWGEPVFRAAFQEVADSLGLDLAAMAWGRRAVATAHDSADLQVTHFALSWALGHALAARIGPPALCFGHSLGEICALIFAGAIPMAEGAGLLRLRGTYMERARRATPQDMLVVQCGDLQQLRGLIGTGFEGSIFISNLNSPEQTLVSGSLEALKAFGRLLEDRLIPARLLGTGIAFHSPLLEDAARQLEPIIDALPTRTPAIPFLCCGAGRCLTQPTAIRAHLKAHLLAPVEWRRAMRTACALAPAGEDCSIYEIGPGKTLRNLYAKEQGGGSGPRFVHCLDPFPQGGSLAAPE